MEGNERPDPPDPSQSRMDITSFSPKRPLENSCSDIDSDVASKARKTSPEMNSISASKQHVYSHSLFVDGIREYAENDYGPFIVHLSKELTESDSSYSIRPIKKLAKIMEPHRIKVSREENKLGLKPCVLIGPDVELKEVPSNGEEYLLKVMKEREHYPEITTCTQDIAEFVKNQDIFFEEIPKAVVCDKLKPTIDWQNEQVEDFSEVRMRIGKLRASKGKYKDQIKELLREPTRLYEWKRFFKQVHPSMSVVVGLPNALVDKALENMVYVLNGVKPGDSIDYMKGLWIYSLLCVVQPLLLETTGILRDLARKCAEIRANIDPEAENAMEAVAPMNIFICLVSRYFRQYDLAD